MSQFLHLTGYDLTDEGPGRTVNEDATLVREDLGLFAVADGAGGRGRGDVAANLALRTIENYIGSTVRKSHERPDRDALGTPVQARRISAAVHRAHHNILEVLKKDPDRQGMASTITAALLAPRTSQMHIAHVGDSRCYRLRHGRLELLTQDHTIGNEILERKPETADEVLENLPRNSVVSALGMAQDLRVSVRTLDLLAGDRFLLCTDGLTIAVDFSTIWTTMRAVDPPSVITSELLSHALAARTHDNIGIVVVDCREKVVDEQLDTRRYNEVPLKVPSAPPVQPSEGPSSSDFLGPEIVAAEALDDFGDDEPMSEDDAALGEDALEPVAPGSPLVLAPEPDLPVAPVALASEVEAVEQWNAESEFPTVPLQDKNGLPISTPNLEITQEALPPDLDFPPSEDGEDSLDFHKSSGAPVEDGDLEFEEGEEEDTVLSLSVIPDQDPGSEDK